MAKTRTAHVLDLMDRPNFLGDEFKGASWDPWRTFLRTLFGLPMKYDDWKLYKQCTARDGNDLPADGFDEAFVCVGRRGGKSFIMALIAIYMACFRDWTKHLSAGESATVMIIATDKFQAKVILKYVIGLLHSVPSLKAKIIAERAMSIDLTDRVNVEITTCNFRSIRGRTVVCAIAEEIAFWRNEESANPDSEILQALRPSLATTPGSMLLCISSPYSRRGELWRAYREHFGKTDDDVLFWKADTATMNPALPQKIIDAAYKKDRAAASAEYGAEFRTDIADFVSREAVESCIEKGVFERPYQSKYRYVAFADPSGGSSDSFTVAVAHREKMEDGTFRMVNDAVREYRAPFDPSVPVADIAKLLKTYKVKNLTGDKYAANWVTEAFRKCGIKYVHSTRSKSELFVDVLPIINSGTADLLDTPKDRLVEQFCGLERRTSRSGKDSIDHAPGGKDDLCNAVAGVLVECNAKQPFRIGMIHCSPGGGSGVVKVGNW